MNHEAERSSNVFFDETSSANVLSRWTTGRTQGMDPSEEERIDWRQKRHPGEWRKKPNSWTGRLLDRLLGIEHDLIDQGRIFLQGITPSPIPPTRLERAFFEILRETARDARPPFRIVVTGHPKTLSSAVEDQVYVVQREALSNVIRHAEATSIEAEVEYFPRRLRLMIRDNGCGFEPRVLRLGRGTHRGIRTMAEQAKAMDAQLQIWTKPGSGTEVELSLAFDPRSMPTPGS